jgi:hypothetical protein
MNPSGAASIARALACSAAALFLTACGSSGPIAVDPDRNFAGLGAIVNDLPDGGTLDIFLVHGMRADKPQTYADVIAAVTHRLQLEEIPDAASAAPVSLVDPAPDITLDGIPVFNAGNWHEYGPRVSIARYASKRGNKRVNVNFYRFEYWQALAYMKCAFVIAPDTRVVGESPRSRFCSSPPYTDKLGSRLSTSPEFGNRWLKTEIMEWGLADATIATSAYRAILRQAVQEMLAMSLQEALARGHLDDPTDTDAQHELKRVEDSQMTRFAFISESLGSYVIHDALTASLLASSAAPGPAPAPAPAPAPDAQRTTAPSLKTVATIVVVCGASQVHMFANQLALLRLSELRVVHGRDGDARASSSQGGVVDDNVPGRSHFFRGCPTPEGPKPTSAAGQFGAEQVVAYHEPNDLLTYYTSDRPGFVGDANRNTINVVVPYTTKWVYFLLADPSKAHTDQPQQPAIMDMVVCGRQMGSRPACDH